MPTLPLVLLYARETVLAQPFFIENVIDRNKDSFKFIQVSQLNSEFKSQIEGVLVVPGNVPVIDRAFIESLPKLRVISSVSVGCNHIDVSAASARNIHVGNTAHACGDAVADHVFAILMASARNVVQGDRFAKGPDTTDVSTARIIKIDHLGVFRKLS